MIRRGWRAFYRAVCGVRRYGMVGYVVRPARLQGMAVAPSWRRVSAGFEMELTRRDFADQEFYLGDFDPPLSLAIEKLVRRGDVCIDVGAQKGYVTLQLAMRAGAEGRVHAFEPDPRAREILTRNCSRNGMDQVRIYDCALAGEDERRAFHLCSQIGWSGMFVHAATTAMQQQQIEVEACALDTLVRRGTVEMDLPRLSFVKIDAEGAEPYILSGMSRVLDQGSPVLWIEINAAWLDAAGSSAEEVCRVLDRLGFCPFVPRCQRRAAKRAALVLEPLDARRIREHGECFNIAAFRQRTRSRLEASGVRVMSPARRG